MKPALFWETIEPLEIFPELAVFELFDEFWVLVLAEELEDGELLEVLVVFGVLLGGAARKAGSALQAPDVFFPW